VKYSSQNPTGKKRGEERGGAEPIYTELLRKRRGKLHPNLLASERGRAEKSNSRSLLINRSKKGKEKKEMTIR